jgi:ATP-dependent DNA helicase RecG
MPEHQNIEYKSIWKDDIHGNLFEQVERTMELLLTKYTKVLISYRGLSRIENMFFNISAKFPLNFR